MPVFIDQTGRSISLDKTPERIISLVPSQTELLFDLGLNKEIAGITKYCIHPEEWFHTKTRVGGTKQLKMDIIHQLRPDLIIANKEENLQEEIEALANDYPVWLTDIKNLDDALKMIEDVGKLVDKQTAAQSLVKEINKGFDSLHSQHKTVNPKPQTAYLIWQKPYMTVGGDTFINDMLSRCGFENIFSNKTRYPEITVSQLQTTNCQLLLLPSEPFPFKQKHLDELQIHLPNTKIVLVDGEMFSWYGSRLLSAAEYFKKLIANVL
jgi:ABC-type Fe3+-hydroxamate transport system substrate-binding protein